ncbi:MAG: RecQ family zinc-binding domain-containing protein, partial [Muribaculaceae bacterium]|nr:RecQ family zinc-binding domain-containing protein [Muribaculaceae bacterium]
GTAIVYVRSRKRTGEIADYLLSAGISAAAYHAGLSHELKEERQNSWKNGTIRVMVATNAFGMGIDKPDVRVVIHYDLPPSLEEYYQEAGRAGRDGGKSYAVLLTSRTDRGVMRRRVTEAFPARDIIKKIYERVCNNLHISIGEGYDTLKEFDIEKFCATFGYQPRQCRAALRILEQAGYLEYMEEADRRARVTVTCDREELYHLKGLSPLAERVLTCLLRGYTGLFADYVCINEATIARALDTTERDIYEALLELGRSGTISYIPRSRMPLMYIPTAREEPRYLQIGRDIYEARKEIMSRRVEAMIDYAFNPRICRENRMLEYFGELRKKECGRCDTCRGRRKSEADDPRVMITRVLDYMNRHPEGVDLRILDHDLRASLTPLAEAISWLSGEGHITITDGYVRLTRETERQTEK